MKSIYRQIIITILANNKNKVFSPYAFCNGIELLKSITSGSTEAQLDYICERNKLDEENLANVKTASSMWISEDFSCDLKEADSDEIFVIKMGTQDANDTIRKWIGKVTGEFLDECINIETTKDTVLELLSTLYYKSPWLSSFDKSQSFTGFFHSGNEDVKCDFMKKKIRIPFWEKDMFKSVSIGFETGEELWLVLPKDGYDSVAAMDSFLNSSYQEDYIESMVQLTMPKIDMSEQIDLVSYMKKLGITHVFDTNSADFSKITNEKGLALTRAWQTTRIKWDEDGIEAASIVEFGISRSCIFPESEVVDFILDRPFFFMISSIDKIPLLAGIVERPINGKFE